MHDIAVVQGILDEIVKQAGEKKPKEITIVAGVGALRFVDPENAKFWLLEMLKKEFGPGLKASVTIETILPEIKCDCGFSGKVKEYSATHDMVHLGLYEMACPKCKGKKFALLNGQGCVIKKLDIK